jgi:hypothetical protein
VPNHRHDDQILLWINPELRSCCSGPKMISGVSSGQCSGTEQVPIRESQTHGKCAIHGKGELAVLAHTDAVNTIREATRGHMNECIVEAVGADATIELELKLAAKRGCVSVTVDRIKSNGAEAFRIGSRRWRK